MMTLLCSCVSYTKFPELPAKPQSVNKCVKLPLPEPIPKIIHISIENGKVEADQGGDILIRNYAKLRKEIKALWYTSP